MFFLRYMRNELVRRRGRTILTLLGLGLGVALVVAVASVSSGLDKAQKDALNPLAGIGTDLTVTLAPQQNQGGFGGGGTGGSRDLVRANQSVLTDLSKLGKPGTHFVHDFFLPGTQLTFNQSAASQIASLNGVAQVAPALTLLAEHQEGVVPKIVATLKTQAKTFSFNRNIPRPTAAQFQQMQACLAKLGGSSTPSTPTTPGGGLGGGSGGNGGLGGGGGGRGSFDRGAFAKCLPASLRKLRTRFTAPSQTLRQVLNPPQTNISTTAYTIGGVDQAHPTLGSVTPAQVTKGTFLPAAGGKQALLSTAYAKKQSLTVGSTLDLNGTRFTVVGLVQPAVGGQSADVYLPLQQLQTLASQKSLANVVLVRAKSNSDVSLVKSEIQQADPQAQVATAQDVANTVTGSLVSAKNLAHGIGLVLAIVAAIAAFLLAALLALSSVGKRVREIGTLKALGWTQGQVVRQIAGESLASGILGGVLGIGLGVIVALVVDAYGPTLTAKAPTGSAASATGVAAGLVRTASRTVSLHAPLGVTVLAIGFALALLGGLVAGTAGAMRAARLRPADALRTLE